MFAPSKRHFLESRGDRVNILRKLFLWLWRFSLSLSLSVWLCWVVCILRECGLTAPCLLKTKKMNRARIFTVDFQNNVDTSSRKSRFVLPPIWRYDAPFGVFIYGDLWFWVAGLLKRLIARQPTTGLNLGVKGSNYWINAVNLYCRSLMTSAVRMCSSLLRWSKPNDWRYPDPREWLLLSSLLYRQTANVPHIYRKKTEMLFTWINIKIVQPCFLLDIQTVKFELFVSSSGRMGFPQCRNKISCKFVYSFGHPWLKT